MRKRIVIPSAMLNADISSHHKEWRMSSITMTDNKTFLNELARPVGHSHPLTDPAKTARYRKVSVPVRATRWPLFSRVHIEPCGVCSTPALTLTNYSAMQAANTGLTEGPRRTATTIAIYCDFISTQRLDKLHLLDNGQQVLASPGTTLYALESA